MDKIALLGILFYILGVIYYNTSYLSFWDKVEKNIDVTLEEIEKAKNELYYQDISDQEFLEKCEILKDLADDTYQSTSIEIIDKKEELLEIIEEDIEYLIQDLNYDITICDSRIHAIKERILQLEQLKNKFEFKEFEQLNEEYEEGRLAFIEKIENELLV